MTSKYRTLKDYSEGLYKEKGSKFLAFARPVQSLQAIEKELLQFQKDHHRAHHHCYAYVLGPEGREFKAYDGGEPKHSAGDPILGQIRSQELTNTLVVVIRYFGGSKLGLAGLTRAYKEAARLALDNGKIVEKELSEIWTLSFGYPDMNEVMRLVKELGLTISNQEQREKVKMELVVPLTKSVEFRARIKRLHKVIIDTKKIIP